MTNREEVFFKVNEMLEVIPAGKIKLGLGILELFFDEGKDVAYANCLKITNEKALKVLKDKK